MYNDVNINLEGRDTEMTDALLGNVKTTQVTEDTHVIITVVTPEVQQQSSSVSSGFISKMLYLYDIVFEDRVKYLEDDFLEFKQTNLFAEAVSSIPGIVDKYLANKMNEAVKAVVQLQSDRLRKEAHAENEDFINKIDENIKKIIKEQVKVQVKEQVSKILPRIKKSVSEQLEAEVLIRSSNKAKTSYAKTLYKALVDAYETDKDILATYGDTVTFKRRRDDEDEDDEPSAGSNRGSKRTKAGKEPESTSAPKDKTSKSTGSSKEGSKYKTRSTGNSAQAEEQVYTKPSKPPTPDRDWNKTLLANHGPIQPWISTLSWNEDPHESFNELDTPEDLSASCCGGNSGSKLIL
ncbi:hypothetical protein Tco_0436593 [Tanacetum coccineum]